MVHGRYSRTKALGVAEGGICCAFPIEEPDLFAAQSLSPL